MVGSRYLRIGPMVTLRLFIVLAIIHCVDATQFCAFQLGNDTRYYVCHLREICCRVGCCASLASQFFHMWYLWLLLLLIVLACSSGGWWYRYCRQEDQLSAYPRGPITAINRPIYRTVPPPFNYRFRYQRGQNPLAYRHHQTRPVNRPTIVVRPPRRACLNHAAAAEHDDDEHVRDYPPARRHLELYKMRHHRRVRRCSASVSSSRSSISSRPPSYTSTNDQPSGSAGPVVLYSSQRQPQPMPQPTNDQPSGSAGPVVFYSSQHQPHRYPTSPPPQFAGYHCPYYQLYGPPPSYDSIVHISDDQPAPQCRLFLEPPQPPQLPQPPQNPPPTQSHSTIVQLTPTCPIRTDARSRNTNTCNGTSHSSLASIDTSSSSTSGTLAASATNLTIHSVTGTSV